MTDGSLAAVGLTFDDILEAVQDSRRGRWFLEEFKKRNASAEIRDVLAAINRIESRINSLADSGAAASELARVKTAISTTRQAIAKTDAGLSAEGRLFADLAERARKAMGSSESASGVSQAIRLIDDLDRQLNAVRSNAETSANSDQYFSRDSDLFEKQPVAAKPVLVSSRPEPVAPETPQPASENGATVTALPKNEGVQLGARLVITHTSAKPGEPSIQESETTPVVTSDESSAREADAKLSAEASPFDPGAIASSPEAAASKGRIVIIRRTPEEMSDMPLPAEAEPSAA